MDAPPSARTTPLPTVRPPAETWRPATMGGRGDATRSLVQLIRHIETDVAIGGDIQHHILADLLEVSAWHARARDAEMSALADACTMIITLRTSATEAALPDTMPPLRRFLLWYEALHDRSPAGRALRRAASAPNALPPDLLRDLLSRGPATAATRAWWWQTTAAHRAPPDGLRVLTLTCAVLTPPYLPPLLRHVRAWPRDMRALAWAMLASAPTPLVSLEGTRGRMSDLAVRLGPPSGILARSGETVPSWTPHLPSVA